MKKFIKYRILAICMALHTILLSACGSNVTNNSSNSKNKEYEPGEHILLEVDRNYNPFWGKNKKFSLESPKGYKIIDYDYDKTENFEYNDYVYVNKDKVFAKDSNDFGTVINDNSNSNESDKDIYGIGEHIIVNVDRSFNPFWGKNDVKTDLKAPAGYNIIDYDYDKTENFEFETITYANNDDVKVETKEDFGTPLNNIKKDDKDYYDIGEHKIVTVNRNINLLFGKNETKSITAPLGYKVIDYDYDKTENFEFETILYENVVPVTKSENDFGTPIEEIENNNSNSNVYDIGEHVLVKIVRDLNLFIGYNGKAELEGIDGYELLDYDYDKNENFEFQTYVYVNNKKIKADDINTFGNVIEEEKILRK